MAATPERIALVTGASRGIGRAAALALAATGAHVIVVFWCEHSSASEEVAREYTLGIELGKDVLPVLLDATPLPPDLARFQWVDFRRLVGGAHPSAGDLDGDLDGTITYNYDSVGNARPSAGDTDDSITYKYDSVGNRIGWWSIGIDRDRMADVLGSALESAIMARFRPPDGERR